MADFSSLIGKYNPIHKRTLEPGVTHSYQGKRTQEEPSKLDQLKKKLKEMRMKKSQLIRDHKFNQGFFKMEDEDFRGAELYLEQKIKDIESGKLPSTGDKLLEYFGRDLDHKDYWKSDQWKPTTAEKYKEAKKNLSSKFLGLITGD